MREQYGKDGNDIREDSGRRAHRLRMRPSCCMPRPDSTTGASCPCGTAAQTPGADGHLRGGSEHQLFQRLCLLLQVLRVLSGARRKRDGYVLSFEEIGRKIDETLALGGTQILMQGGHHPDLPLSWYEEMLRYIKAEHPVHIHAFSPPEVVFWSERGEHFRGRGHPPLARGRAGLHPRRRRRDPGGRGPLPRGPEQMPVGPVARGHGRGPTLRGCGPPRP